MKLAYHFENNKSSVSELDDNVVKVSFAPISDKPCSEVMLLHPEQAIYDDVITEAKLLIYENNKFFFAKQPINKTSNIKGYHSGIMRWRSKICQHESELRDFYTDSTVDSGNTYYIIHDIKLYTNNYKNKYFYIEMDVESVYDHQVNIVGLLRQNYINEIIDTL